jgi:hypothetical protein
MMFVNHMVCHAVMSLCDLIILSVCLVIYPTIPFLKLEQKRNVEVKEEGKRGEISGRMMRLQSRGKEKSKKEMP